MCKVAGGSILDLGHWRLVYVSDLDPFSTPQLFHTYYYNHARRLRLEKLLYLELSRSSNGFFKPLLDPDGVSLK